MEELVRPNWHIALIHCPIAFLVIGSLIECFCFLGWRRGSFRVAGRWMVLLGAILSVPATFSGLYALGDVVPRGLSGLDLLDTRAAETVRDHLWMMSVATGAAMLLVMIWIGFSDAWRDRLSILFKLALLCVCALTLVGAHHGGDIVYAHKIGPHDDGPATMPTSMPTENLDKALNDAFDAEQVHVVVAGFAIALACVCVGFTFRAASQPVIAGSSDDVMRVHQIAAAFSADPVAASESRRLAQEQAMRQSVSHTAPVKLGRFWLLTFAIVLLTAITGVWYLTISEGTRDFETLREVVTKPQEGDPAYTRRFVHILCGLVIAADALLLTLMTAMGVRARLFAAMLALPMFLALALQVWLGVLLVLDGPVGKLTQFGP